MALELELTQRQREVAEGLVAGKNIPTIAEELGITESRVNQIVRALKDRFKVETQAGIAATFRRSSATEIHSADEVAEEFADHSADETLVPDYLNGPNATVNRVTAILALAFLISAIGLALVLFATTMSDASDGKVEIEGQGDRPIST
ncbi:LuxR C-terminal-related transcriptional regulator [uncultured Erythrobacter sp.]|uniref:helix-turn-helix transcriptional regulator n=1 Tax=uncultured Erythrobacter sp. TaxID=263913 RepID=UPI0026097580|nr:LuxR C-terminal-related transcriptional regulator [uncultured Erythrobacter sp.]